MKNRWTILLLLMASLLLFAACGADYTEEYNQMSERYNEMDAEWTVLLSEIEAIQDNPPDFDAIDTFYDKAIAHAEADLTELTEMSNTLDTYKDGINEQDYEDFKEILVDGIGVTEISRDQLIDDRAWSKANYLSNTYGMMVDEWNAINADDMTTEMANDYLARMETLSEKLDSIKVGIDVETYDTLREQIDAALSVIHDTLYELK